MIKSVFGSIFIQNIFNKKNVFVENWSKQGFNVFRNDKLIQFKSLLRDIQGHERNLIN